MKEFKLDLSALLDEAIKELQAINQHFEAMFEAQTTIEKASKP